MQNKSQLEEGNWIKTNSQNGELVIGYVETVDSLSGIVDVKVVNSDNNDIVGKKMKFYEKLVKQLPVAAVNNKIQLLFLIDLALTTRDEAWFNELTAKLNSISSKELIN